MVLDKVLAHNPTVYAIITVIFATGLFKKYCCLALKYANGLDLFTGVWFFSRVRSDGNF